MAAVELDLNVISERPSARDDIESDLDIVLDLVTSRGIGDQPASHALNLCVVIDRSGSMAKSGKLQQAKRSCVSIWESLNPRDHLTVLAFDEDVVSVVNPQTPPGEVKDRILGIQAGGTTNLSKGWYLALVELQSYASPQHVNRVILLSDGQVNRGEGKPSVLGSESGRARDELGVTTSTIGIGRDFQEDILGELARRSGGRMWFIGDSAIEEIIREEFSGALSVHLDRPSLRLDLPVGVTVERELNDLSKNAGRYRLRQVKANDHLSFAVRLRVDPEQVVDRAMTIGATLFDATTVVAETSTVVALDTVERFAASPEEPFVALVVAKYLEAIGDERIIERLDAGDMATAVEMLHAQGKLMMEVERKLAGARVLSFEESSDRETAERRRRHERQRAMNQRVIAEKSALAGVYKLVALLRAIGEDKLARGLLMSGRKQQRAGQVNAFAMQGRSELDDLPLAGMLLEARTLCTELLRRHPDLGDEIAEIRQNIDENLARYS